MAWYDTAWDWMGGHWLDGNATPIGLGDTTYTPPGAPAGSLDPTRLTPQQEAAFNPSGNPALAAAFNPYNNQQFQNAANSVGAYGDAGARQASVADDRLMQGFSGPAAYSPQTVTANNPNANTSASGAGIDRAADQLANANMSRGDQQNVYNTAMDWAQGNMPSVGQNIANEAGVRAEEQFQRAGSEANQNYGSAAANAAQAYGDAQAAQNEATRMAGVNAARGVRDNSSDAILRQAALTSAARGNNMGMALRTGLQGAAAQSADANRQGARLVQDANSQASYNAAMGQRATQNAQLQGNLATQGTQERAGFAASAAEQAASFQAGQIAAGEQQAALNLAANQANAVRGTDINATQAATGLANTGVAVDQMVNASNQSNADRSFSADTFNSGQAQQNAQFGQQIGLSYDQLNSGNFNQVANRGAAAAQFGLGGQMGMAGQAAGMQQQLAMQQIMGNQQLAQMYFASDEATKQRMLDFYGMQQGIATDRRGQNTGLWGGGASGAGAGIATVMSDKRAKKGFRDADAPNFRKATSQTWEYEDTTLPGTAPGRHHGPMAQELPDDVLEEGEDGFIRVDIGRLALALASSVGDLQRKVDEAA